MNFSMSWPGGCLHWWGFLFGNVQDVISQRHNKSSICGIGVGILKKSIASMGTKRGIACRLSLADCRETPAVHQVSLGFAAYIGKKNEISKKKRFY